MSRSLTDNLGVVSLCEMITPALADECDNDDEARLDSNKNKSSNVSGWAQRGGWGGGRQRFKSTAGNLRRPDSFRSHPPHMSISLTPPAAPHQTPAPDDWWRRGNLKTILPIVRFNVHK